MEKGNGETGETRQSPELDVVGSSQLSGLENISFAQMSDEDVAVCLRLLKEKEAIGEVAVWRGEELEEGESKLCAPEDSGETAMETGDGGPEEEEKASNNSQPQPLSPVLHALPPTDYQAFPAESFLTPSPKRPAEGLKKAPKKERPGTILGSGQNLFRSRSHDGTPESRREEAEAMAAAKAWRMLPRVNPKTGEFYVPNPQFSPKAILEMKESLALLEKEQLGMGGEASVGESCVVVEAGQADVVKLSRGQPIADVLTDLKGGYAYMTLTCNEASYSVVYLVEYIMYGGQLQHIHGAVFRVLAIAPADDEFWEGFLWASGLKGRLQGPDGEDLKRLYELVTIITGGEKFDLMQPELVQKRRLGLSAESGRRTKLQPELRPFGAYAHVPAACISFGQQLIREFKDAFAAAQDPVLGDMLLMEAWKAQKIQATASLAELSSEKRYLALLCFTKLRCIAPYAKLLELRDTDDRNLYDAVLKVPKNRDLQVQLFVYAKALEKLRFSRDPTGTDSTPILLPAVLSTRGRCLLCGLADTIYRNYSGPAHATWTSGNPRCRWCDGWMKGPAYH